MRQAIGRPHPPDRPDRPHRVDRPNHDDRHDRPNHGDRHDRRNHDDHPERPLRPIPVNHGNGGGRRDRPVAALAPGDDNETTDGSPRWNFANAKNLVEELFSELGHIGERDTDGSVSQRTLLPFIRKFVVYAAYVVSEGKQPKESVKINQDRALMASLQEVINDLIYHVQIPINAPETFALEFHRNRDENCWLPMRGNPTVSCHKKSLLIFIGDLTHKILLASYLVE